MKRSNMRRREANEKKRINIRRSRGRTQPGLRR